MKTGSDVAGLFDVEALQDDGDVTADSDNKLVDNDAYDNDGFVVPDGADDDTLVICRTSSFFY